MATYAPQPAGVQDLVSRDLIAPASGLDSPAVPVHGFRRLRLKHVLVEMGPKRLAAQRFRPLAPALLAIVLAVVLYRIQRDAGFAVLVVLAAAAGWLLAGRAAALICLGEVIAVGACFRSGLLPWPTALLQVAVVATLTGFAHRSAEMESVNRLTAVRERRLAGLSFLLEAAESLAGSPDRNAILNTAVRATARAVSRPASDWSAHAAFHEVVADQVRIAHVVDEPSERDIATNFEYPLAGNQAARAAIRTGRPALVRPDHLTGPLRELAERLGWQVLVMAPVYCRGSLHGLIAATARDAPAVDQLQLYMLGTLARFTTLGLDTVAVREDGLLAATNKDLRDAALPSLLPGAVAELLQVVRPIKDQILEVRAAKNGSTHSSDAAARAVSKLDDLISTLASRAAIDPATGLLSRELGLAALERDVLRTRRMEGGHHCIAVVHVATAEAANATELIRLVADRLRSRLRRDDLIFKYAEDELVCSFADMDSSDALPIMNRIQTELAAEVGYSPFTIGFTSLSPRQSPQGQVQIA